EPRIKFERYEHGTIFSIETNMGIIKPTGGNKKIPNSNGRTSEFGIFYQSADQEIWNFNSYFPPNSNKPLQWISVIYCFLPSLSSQERLVNLPSMAISLPLATYFSTTSTNPPLTTTLC